MGMISPSSEECCENYMRLLNFVFPLTPRKFIKVFLYWGIINISYCISFRCTKWFNVCIHCKTFATRSRYHLLPYVTKTFGVCVMRIFKLYSLGNFQICTTILSTIVIMLYITSQWLTYFITGSVHLKIHLLCNSSWVGRGQLKPFTGAGKWVPLASWIITMSIILFLVWIN